MIRLSANSAISTATESFHCLGGTVFSHPKKLIPRTPKRLPKAKYSIRERKDNLHVCLKGKEKIS